MCLNITCLYNELISNEHLTNQTQVMIKSLGSFSNPSCNAQTLTSIFIKLQLFLLNSHLNALFPNRNGLFYIIFAQI